jgi:hypothetical protein
LHHDKTRKDSLPPKDIFVSILVIFIVAWLTVLEMRQAEILTTFGHWIGFGGLDGCLLLKTGDSHCTITAVRKSVTLDRPNDWPGQEDTSLKRFVKIDTKSGLTVHI